MDRLGSIVPVEIQLLSFCTCDHALVSPDVSFRICQYSLIKLPLLHSDFVTSYIVYYRNSINSNR